MGFTAHASMHRQATGDDMDTLWNDSCGFGPFDDWDEVVEWMNDHIRPPEDPSA
jgi:hypothetical protein